MFGIKFTTNRETAQAEAPASPTQSLHWFVETVFGDRALALDCYEDNGQWIYTLAHDASPHASVQRLDVLRKKWKAKIRFGFGKKNLVLRC